MPIIRAVKDEAHFSTLRQPAQDSRLSYRARGLLWYLLSRPNGWEIQERDLIEQGTEGRDAIRAAIGELKTFGYVKRTRERNPETGMFDWITEVHEKPLTENQEMAPLTENQETDNQELVSRKSIDKRKRSKREIYTVTDVTVTPQAAPPVSPAVEIEPEPAEQPELAQAEQSTYLQVPVFTPQVFPAAPAVPRAPRNAHRGAPAVQVYAATFPAAAAKLAPADRERIATTIGADQTALQAWHETLDMWRTARYNPFNLAGLLARASKAIERTQAYAQTGNGLGGYSGESERTLERRMQRYTAGWVTGADLAAYFGDAAPAAD